MDSILQASPWDTLQASRQVMAVIGDTYLGREDSDNCNVDFCIQNLKRKDRGKNIAGNECAFQRLRTQCKREKQTFSPSTQVTIGIGSFPGGIDFFCSTLRANSEVHNMNSATS